MVHADAAKGLATSKSRSPVELLALSEILKLIFNVTYYFPTTRSCFTTSISPILDILIRVPLMCLPLPPPINLLLNALMNLELSEASMSPLFLQPDSVAGVEHLIKILDFAVTDAADTTMETTTTPIISLLSQVYGRAPRNIQQFMRKRLLPSPEERSKPLGKGPSLAARLLRLSTSAVSTNVKEPLSNLLFDLSDQDSAKFVENVGFGHASGFLHNHNLPTPRLLDCTSNKDGQDGTIPDVNFVTGQNIADELDNVGPEMTEDEKMREAERLFVLFERSACFSNHYESDMY